MKEFIVDHYLLIMIVAAFLVFALLGYIIDTTRNKKKDDTVNQSKEENMLLTENSVPDIQPEVEESEEDIVNTEESLSQISEVDNVNTKDNLVLAEQNEKEDAEPITNSEEAKDNQ
ncbi:MAG: hypothetical protein PHD03_01445 [Bacilli bacterium]|nr:hypothetical protein [Bacilli bacterium]